ncbi:hypothetical protein EYC84_003241 [Monilinia fructicola]|uniref:Uncharacterized protein n=1 Tax=Monilinia fructicola TaxID=38448 RepID=A0A5M9JW09_MONFR|nr:hypothetical protein EYC84_003241 [Monilinia fructicola]
MWNPDALQRTTEGLIAVLLSLKKKPLIRYEKNSNGPRTSWYKDGRVDLSEVPEIRPELKEVVLSQDQDPFFKKNMYLNFGDLGALQSKNTQSFRKLSGNVSKHVTLVGELSRKVGSENLLEVSEVEQSLACNDAHASDLKNVQRLIQSPTQSSLFIIRPYNRTNQQGALLTCLNPRNIFSGARDRFKGLKGVENVYTQHSPRLELTLQDLIKGKLRDQQYPFVEGVEQPVINLRILLSSSLVEPRSKKRNAYLKINATSPGIRVVFRGYLDTQ